jgi:hypothetical protein
MSGTLVNAFSSTRPCTMAAAFDTSVRDARRQSAMDAPREWPYIVKRDVGKREAAKASAAA